MSQELIQEEKKDNNIGVILVKVYKTNLKYIELKNIINRNTLYKQQKVLYKRKMTVIYINLRIQKRI